MASWHYMCNSNEATQVDHAYRLMLMSVFRNDRKRFQKLIDMWQPWYRPDILILSLFSLSVIIMLEEDLKFGSSTSNVYRRSLAICAMTAVAILLLFIMNSTQESFLRAIETLNADYNSFDRHLLDMVQLCSDPIFSEVTIPGEASLESTALFPSRIETRNLCAKLFMIFCLIYAALSVLIVRLQSSHWS